MSGPQNTLAISPAARDALQTWLDHQRALKGAADNTLIAYHGDVTEFLAFISVHHGGAQGLAGLGAQGVDFGLLLWREGHVAVL